jgi:hypothetical protein
MAELSVPRFRREPDDRPELLPVVQHEVVSPPGRTDVDQAEVVDEGAAEGIEGLSFELTDPGREGLQRFHERRTLLRRAASQLAGAADLVEHHHGADSTER